MLATAGVEAIPCFKNRVVHVSPEALRYVTSKMQAIAGCSKNRVSIRMSEATGFTTRKILSTPDF